jgi:hypothetical protein
MSLEVVCFVTLKHMRDTHKNRRKIARFLCRLVAKETHEKEGGGKKRGIKTVRRRE